MLGYAHANPTYKIEHEHAIENKNINYILLFRFGGIGCKC